MQTIIGPFHPYLEDALVEEILTFKRADPLCPLLILVPSDALRRRLKVLFAGEHELHLLNLPILTFHQLSLRLVEELYGTFALELQDDLFLEEALRLTIRMGLPGTSAFSTVEERNGGCAALWQTLRDLKDGMVEPHRVLEALREGYLGPGDDEKISHLLVLFEALVSCCKKSGIKDYSDLDILATGQIPASEFLRQFRQIFYYGFYDLTQVQVDLFQSVARHYPTTLLFPLMQGHPAWAFAQRFYERYVQGLPQSSEIRNPARAPKTLSLFADETDNPDQPLPENFHCTILSCFGARDEVVTAAKEILRLVADEGLAFHEIGVVARHLEAYVPWIKEVFKEHQVPIATSAQDTLTQFPLVKAVLLLLNISAKDYLRPYFIDLVSSPFFDTRPFCPGTLSPRPDLWDLLTRRLGITKGVEEWRRLERTLSGDLILEEESGEDHDPRTITVSTGQVRILWDLFHALRRDLDSLPVEGTWSQYVGRWKGLLEKYLGIAEITDRRERGREDEIRAAILDQLEGLSGLDAIHPRISLIHFIQTYRRCLERSSLPLTERNANGVRVLDAMAARGVPFHALFVMGLNEGIFPRTIREDAFLRDRHRRVLETVLGYKVSEKLAAFDEEKLLFTLLVEAAQERLYCLYQRSDESGRVLTPSWYLTELRRVLRANQTRFTETIIPRGFMEKQAAGPFSRHELLLPKEVALHLSLRSQDPTPIVELFSLAPSLYRRGRRAMEHLEESKAPLGAYDGTLGPLPEYWDHLRAQGLSPTALELYALCPFRFFARNMLRLGRLERPEEATTVSPIDIGRLTHLILKSLYEELIGRGYFAASNSSIDVRSLLEDLARKIFAAYELDQPVGYPVAWEILQERLMELLTQVVARDLQELSQSGYRPLALEVEAREKLGQGWPGPLAGLTIRGRMDRIDREPTQNLYRVIDYKVKSGRHRLPQDKDLSRSALRGQRLQPPFYLLLGKNLTSREEGAPDPTVEAALYFLAPQWPEGPLVRESFPAHGWDGAMGEELKETLSSLLDGIRNGRFFIAPGIYCSHCEVAELCRKNHLPSLWRAQNDPLCKPHQELRQKDLPQESAHEVKRASQGRRKDR